MDARFQAGDSPRFTVAQGKASSSPFPSTAMVVADAAGSVCQVASLTVLDRLVVSLSRAGVRRIVVVGGNRPRLSRSTALGLEVEYADEIPSLAGEVLVASGNVLVTAADLQRVMRERGRLVTRDGQLLPVGIMDGLSNDWQARLEQAPRVNAQDLAALVSRDSVKSIEQAYWDSLTSSSDGWVDRHFNRPVGRLLSKKLVSSPVTPNQVSVVSILVGLVAAALFAEGTAGTAVAGAVVLQLSAVLDCIDGDLARALYKQSSLGKWLDIAGDQVVHIGVFLGIGLGLWRSGSPAPVLALGTVAAIGVVLSFLVVLRALRKPSLRGNSRLQKVIDAATNRDFSLLLILCALFQVLDWFLWMAAVGSHVFWLTAVTLQFLENRSALGHAETT